MQLDSRKVISQEEYDKLDDAFKGMYRPIPEDLAPDAEAELKRALSEMGFTGECFASPHTPAGRRLNTFADGVTKKQAQRRRNRRKAQRRARRKNR